MSHLGGRLSELVDGELEGAAADRALRHLADCQDCRDALETERLMKQRLASLVVPEPGDDLLQNLLTMGGPAGPLPPRREHVPGSPRPSFVSPGASLHPAGRHDVRVFAAPAPPTRGGLLAGGQRRSRFSTPQRRVAATLVGAACLVGAGVAGGVAAYAVSPADVVSPVDSFVVRHIATTDVRLGSENSWSGLGGR